MEKHTHILLVDDDPAMLRLFGGILAKAGFDVWPAHDGNEGREVARRLQPDLILLDYRMPVMNGIEALAYLKVEELTKHIPVIFLTSEDLSVEDLHALKELGVDDYIAKGCPVEEMLERINKILALGKTSAT